MKVVINVCFGGYALSPKAYEYLGLEWDGCGYEYCDDRTNPKLVECVEKLGEEAGYDTKLKVVEIPNDIEWEIMEYDGNEWVAEKHRIWD